MQIEQISLRHNGYQQWIEKGADIVWRNLGNRKDDNIRLSFYWNGKLLIAFFEYTVVGGLGFSGMDRNHAIGCRNFFKDRLSRFLG